MTLPQGKHSIGVNGGVRRCKNPVAVDVWDRGTDFCPTIGRATGKGQGDWFRRIAGRADPKAC